MGTTHAPEVRPGVEVHKDTSTQDKLDRGCLVICWDDPVNLMSYVTHVFQQVFKWPKPKAEFHMFEVHTKGKSVLARESFEKAEHLVHQLQKYKLHATLERE